MPHTKQALKKQIQKTHTGCRRCGRTSFHIQKKVCSACGYPSARNRHYNWGKKMIRRKNRGTGRMRYEKDLPRRFKNGFREKVRNAGHQPTGGLGGAAAPQRLIATRLTSHPPHLAPASVPPASATPALSLCMPHLVRPHTPLTALLDVGVPAQTQATKKAA